MTAQGETSAADFDPSTLAAEEVLASRPEGVSIDASTSSSGGIAVDDEVQLQTATALSRALGVIYCFVAVFKLLELPLRPGLVMTALSAVTAGAFFAAAELARRHPKRVEYLDPFALALLFLAAGNSLVQMLMMNDRIQIVGVGICILFSGVIFHSARWMAVSVLGLTALGQIAFSQITGHAPRFLYPAMLGGACVTAFVIHWFRRETILGYVRQRRRDAELLGRLRAALADREREAAERRLAEDSLGESESKWRALIENAPDVIAILDLEGTIRFVNVSVGSDPQEFVGRSAFEFLDPLRAADLQRTIAEIVRTKHNLEIDVPGFLPDGSPGWWHARLGPVHRDGRVVSLLVIARDVTGRKRAEEEKRSLELKMQEAQKLESLGLLAGGVAHDFNNLLTAIIGNADLSLDPSTSTEEVRGNVDRIRVAALRAAELTSQMLAYSGKSKFVAQRVDLGTLVREMAGLLSVAISRRIAVQFDMAPGLPAVEGDPSQLRQVAMNLITNASEAIGDAEGSVAVSVRVTRVEDEAAARNDVGDPLPFGDYLVLEVADDGCGMDETTKSRMFEPFFTTKFTGRGLGMAAVVGIVRSHRGAIRVDSEPGVGTRVTMLLPPLAAEAPSEARPSAARPAATGGGRVLVVDDEQEVLDLSRTILERAGFAVEAASGGDDAVALVENRRCDVDVALVDLTMPRIDGVETCRRLRRLRPHLRFVVTSGYSQDDVSRRTAGLGVAGVLRKPFLPGELVHAIRSALAEPSAALSAGHSPSAQ